MLHYRRRATKPGPRTINNIQGEILQTTLKPLIAVLAIALATSSHAAWAEDSNAAAIKDEKSSTGTKASDEAGVTEMPAIEVRGTNESGYAVKQATSGTKTDTPIQDTPFAVQVVTEQAILDQKTSRIQDAILGNVSSVAPNANGLSDNTNFTIRGFNTGPNVYQDGLLLPYSMNVDTANINTIDVLKGPSAALYGRMPPGGMVNYITKQPLDHSYYSVEESIGSYKFNRSVIDLTGPINDGKTVLYRLDLASTKADSFVQYENSSNVLIAPSVTIKPTDRFQITLQYEYQYVRNVDSDPNFPAFGNRPAPISITTYLEDPGITASNPDTMRKDFYAYQWNYKLGEDWKITNRLASNHLDEHVTNMFGLNMDSSGNFSNGLMYGPAGVKTLSTNLELSGKVKAGDIGHDLLFGIDHLSFEEFFNGIYAQGYLPPTFIPGVQTINIFNPQAGYYTTPSLSSLMSDMADNGFALMSKQRWNGVYVQDMISAYDNRAHLVIGGRYDWSTTGSGSGFGTTAWSDTNASGFTQGNDKGFSPRIGLSVQVLPSTTIYANYSKALGLSNVATGVTVTGQPLLPQWSTQNEVGLKSEFFNKNLSASVSYFDIKQTDIPSFVQSPNIYALIGEARSNGVEVDIEGKMDKNWSLIATASHDIAKITSGYAPPQPWLPSVPSGNYLPAVPTDIGSIWVKYTGIADLIGWRFATGVIFASQAQGDPQNDFQIPGYSVTRGMAAYDFKVDGKKFTAQLNIDNAFNRRYFYGSTAYGNAYSLTPGTPRTLMATLRVEF